VSIEQASPIERLRAAAEAMGPPAPARPVEQWNPAYCGHSGMRIEASGRWLHEGRPIVRPELVRLFASILRREPDGRIMLVTPAEMLAIDVEDAPFVAVEMAAEGDGEAQRLAFRLNTGELVVAGPEHPIRMRDGRPYLHVRRGLEARLERPVWLELAELALAQGGVVRSDGATFRLG
jgi:hypothetical protein